MFARRRARSTISVGDGNSEYSLANTRRDEIRCAVPCGGRLGHRTPARQSRLRIALGHDLNVSPHAPAFAACQVIRLARHRAIVPVSRLWNPVAGSKEGRLRYENASNVGGAARRNIADA